MTDVNFTGSQLDPASAAPAVWPPRMGDLPFVPSGADELEGLPAEHERDLYADLTGVRVLVVDDEVDNRELFVLLLGSCGAEVRSASSAAEAFAALRRDPPHLLVSDIAMPFEDGYNLIRRVRLLSVDEGGRLPALALTAFVGAEHQARALEAGFTRHEPKPVDPDRLIEVVRQLAALLQAS